MVVTEDTACGAGGGGRDWIWRLYWMRTCLERALVRLYILLVHTVNEDGTNKGKLP